MERADRCRLAARDAIADVEPPRLRDLLEDTLAGASMAPGVFAIETARRLGSGSDLEEGTVPDAVVRQAAGVQLIYEGLRLTRRLAHEEPWVRGASADDVAPTAPNPPAETDGPAAGTDGGRDPDLEILAADILVARGFYLLARTEAAEKAVRTVRSFGRDQTRREEPGADPESIDANLERDVLELAVLAGAAAVDRTPTQELLDLADAAVDAVGTAFPPAADCLPFESRPADSPPDETIATDRATSATDP